MTIKTNWDIIPTYILNLGDLKDPYEICHFCKKYNIDWYLYRIKFKGIVDKFGMSADRSRNHGDRVYRQMAHAESWGALRNNGSSGADWRIIEEDFFNRYGIKIDKQFVEIKFWDLTNYPFISTNPRNEVLRMENELIEDYVRIVGEKPIGNINDEAYIKTKGLVATETLEKLFYLETK
jgi:hypothetical protein